MGLTREQITQDWVNRNKEAEVKQARLRAKEKLEGLSDEEKSVIASLKGLADKTSITVVGQMFNLLQTIEAD